MNIQIIQMSIILRTSKSVSARHPRDWCSDDLLRRRTSMAVIISVWRGFSKDIRETVSSPAELQVIQGLYLIQSFSIFKVILHLKLEITAYFEKKPQSPAIRGLWEMGRWSFSINSSLWPQHHPISYWSLADSRCAVCLWLMTFAYGIG